MKPGFIHLAAIAAGAGLFASCGGSGTPESARQDLVPKSGEVKGWDPNGQATVVNGDELFELIDGGAEIYHEFGFEHGFLRHLEYFVSLCNSHFVGSFRHLFKRLFDCCQGRR